jgi:hypothetical protein
VALTLGAPAAKVSRTGAHRHGGAAWRQRFGLVQWGFINGGGAPASCGDGGRVLQYGGVEKG